jgi:hypothetical protein
VEWTPVSEMGRRLQLLRGRTGDKKYSKKRRVQSAFFEKLQNSVILRHLFYGM